MTLEEAIETIADELSEHTPHRDSPFYKACKLGIEALKLNLLMRETYASPELLVLPGETEKESENQPE